MRRRSRGACTWTCRCRRATLSGRVSSTCWSLGFIWLSAGSYPRAREPDEDLLVPDGSTVGRASSLSALPWCFLFAGTIVALAGNTGYGQTVSITCLKETKSVKLPHGTVRRVWTYTTPSRRATTKSHAAPALVESVVAIFSAHGHGSTVAGAVSFAAELWAVTTGSFTSTATVYG